MKANQEAGRKYQVPMDSPVGAILPSSAKSIGSPQYLRDDETGKQWAGATCRHQGPPLQCARPQICAIIDSPCQTTILSEQPRMFYISGRVLQTI